jgi:hypothetical protein
VSKKDTKRVVIDTDVVKASGGETTTHPTSKNCRDFLMTVRALNYRVVMSAEIRKEWNEHASNFARRWWGAMERRKKVCDIGNPPRDKNLRTKISSTARSEKQIETMEKDFHLLNAALATDQSIISLDETVRGLFARASQRVGEIRNIIWVNPDRVAEEEPISWLQNGAPPEPHRQLSA